MISIRDEIAADIPAVRIVNERAFGRKAEADIVDAIRGACSEIVSFVAIEKAQVVGHIMFSPVTVDGSAVHGGMGLAPVAVLPEKQRLGIGSQLVRAGIVRLREAGCPFIIVLGHSEYYPRFGFVPASRRGLKSQWEGVSDNVFMALVLNEEVMKDVRGVARYRPELDSAA